MGLSSSISEDSISKVKNEPDDMEFTSTSINFMGSTKKIKKIVKKKETTENLLQKLENNKTHPGKLEEIMKELWQKLDINNTEYISHTQAKQLFENIYDYLEKKNTNLGTSKDVTVDMWLHHFDPNNNGIISWKEFKQIVILLEESLDIASVTSQTNQMATDVIIIRKITINQYPSDITCSVSYKDQRKKTLKSNSTPSCWHPNYVFFVVSSHSNTIRFSIHPSLSPTTSSMTSISSITSISSLSSLSTTSSSSKISSTSKDGDTINGYIDINIEELLKMINKNNGHYIFKGDIVNSNITHKSPTIEIEFHQEVWSYDTDEPLITENKDPVSMDYHTSLIWNALRKSILAQRTKSNTGQRQLPLPKLKHSSLECYNVFSGLDVPKTDDVFPIDRFALLFIQILGYLPLVDDRKVWSSRQEAIEAIGMMAGDVLPVALDGPWKDRTSDEATTRMFFQGIGSPLLEGRVTEDGEDYYVVDLDWMLRYEVRPGFMPFQGIAYFDKNTQLKHIILYGKKFTPEDPEWEFAKLVIRSSAFALITLREHALLSHFTWSNSTGMATRLYLSPNHPLRHLIDPFMFHAANANAIGIYLLLSEKGMFHRGSAFSYNGLLTAATDFMKEYRFETFPNQLKSKKVDKLKSPYFQDGMALYEIYYDFVNSYVKLYFDDEKKILEDKELDLFWKSLQISIYNGIPELNVETLTEFLTECIFRVSAYHTLVGDVVNYTSDPACVHTKLIKGQLLCSCQTTYQMTTVAATTGAQMPTLLQPCFEKLFLDNDAKKLHTEFQRKLKNLSDDIERMNNERLPFNGFNPKYIMLSTGI